MRFAGPSLIVSLALLAAPAYAQNGTGSYQNDHQYNSGNQQYTPMNRGELQRQGNRMNEQNGGLAENQQRSNGLTNDTRDQIRQSLQNSGFKNVQVLPEAFLIRAQAPDGSRIVMRVTPDSMQGVVLGAANNRNQQQNRSRDEESGSSQANPSDLDNTTGSNWNNNSGSGNSTGSGNLNR